MSGFVVLYQTDAHPVHTGSLSSLAEAIKHRGPDKQRQWANGSVGMCHALFQTTFQSKYEDQPATLDKKVYLVSSSRIDDRKNLLNHLGLNGILNLQTTPDTELILHAYHKWGEACPNYLHGDFAFVIWDEQQQKLFAARDRFGRKQLYYTQKKDTVLIGNTLNAFFSHPSVDKTLHDEAVAAFLLLGKHSWYNKSLSMFKDIHILPPAHTLSFQKGRIKMAPYWELPQNIPLLHYKHPQDYITHFLEVFRSAVSDRLRTPSATILMSGGTDSTSIAAIAKQCSLQTRLQALTVTHNRTISTEEAYFAKIAANYLQIPQQTLDGDSFLFLEPSPYQTTFPLDNAQETLWIHQEKILSGMGRVTLSGDGADELFIYPSTPTAIQEIGIKKSILQIIELKKNYQKSVPLQLGIRTKIKRTLLNFKNKNTLPDIPYPPWINPVFREKLSNNQKWNQKWSYLLASDINKDRNQYFHKRFIHPDWCPEDLLLQADFTPTEKWNPYFDIRLVEFVLSLPSLPWLFNKHILRASMKALLPDSILLRPKTPLGHLHYSLAETQTVSPFKNRKLTHINSFVSQESFNTVCLSTQQDYVQNMRPVLLEEWIKKITLNL